MLRASRTLLGGQCLFISKNSNTLEIEHSQLNSPINIPRILFHLRSTDLANKPHSYDSGTICSQT